MKETFGFKLKLLSEKMATSTTRNLSGNKSTLIEAKTQKDNMVSKLTSVFKSKVKEQAEEALIRYKDNISSDSEKYHDKNN